MKIRTGFVSNSSSSSFVIKLKNPQLDILDTFKTVATKELAIDPKHPLAGIVEEIVDVIIEKAEEGHVIENLKDLMEYNGARTEEDAKEYDPELAESLKDGKIIVGDFEDCSEYEIESYLANVDLNFETDDLEFIHTGGY